MGADLAQRCLVAKSALITSCHANTNRQVLHYRKGGEGEDCVCLGGGGGGIRNISME